MLKDVALFGAGGVAGLFSHECAHKLVGDAFGMDASYNPLKDPFTTYYESEPKGSLEKALFSGAGLIVQNAVSAGIVNSNIKLKENPFALGYLAFTGLDNLKYALFPEFGGDSSDVKSISDAIGVPKEAISGALLLSNLYLGKKVFDNLTGNGSSSGLASKFSPHFTRNGDVGLKYDFGDKHPSSLSFGINPKEGSAKVLFNIPF